MVTPLRNTHKSKRLLAGLFVVLLVVSLATLLLHKNEQGTKTSTTTRQPNSVSYAPSAKSDNSANESRKNNNPQQQASSSANSLNSPSTPPPFSVTIARANPYNYSGSTGIIAAASINGASAAGTCLFTISPHTGAGQTITKSENSEISNSIYVCPGLTIPTPIGSWDVSVTVIVNGSTVNSKWVANPVDVQ
jgi:hypothetical protein